MIMPDRGIREMVWPTNGARPAVYVPEDRKERFGPIVDSQIQPASLDVRLDSSFITHPRDIPLQVRGWIELKPGDCVLGSLVERLNMNADNVLGRVEGKSSWARQFLTIHSAGFIDPGFKGDITLELKNDGHAPIILRPGVIIAQLSFAFLAAPAERLYGDYGLNSHYQGQTGATEAHGL